MVIELSKAKVTIKDELTWGDTERIQSALMAGAKVKGNAQKADNIGFDFDTTAMLEAKYIALECAVNEIEENGEKKQWTRDWQNNLSKSDGDKLYEAVDSLSKN